MKSSRPGLHPRLLGLDRSGVGFEFGEDVVVQKTCFVLVAEEVQSTHVENGLAVLHGRETVEGQAALAVEVKSVWSVSPEIKEESSRRLSSKLN